MRLLLYIFVNVLIVGLFLYSKLTPHKDRLTGNYLKTFNFFDKIFHPILIMRRLPVYFLIDVSESMVGEPIQMVQDGISSIIKDLRTDPYALETVWVSISLIHISYTHLRAHETGRNLVCRLLLEKKKKEKTYLTKKKKKNISDKTNLYK